MSDFSWVDIIRVTPHPTRLLNAVGVVVGSLAGAAAYGLARHFIPAPSGEISDLANAALTLGFIGIPIAMLTRKAFHSICNFIQSTEYR